MTDALWSRWQARVPDEAHILLTLRVHRERSQYVSVCDELDVASCGASIEEAFANVIDAVEIYLDTLEDAGELERTLAERSLSIEPGPSRGEGSVRISARPDEYVSPHRMRVPVGAA